MNTVFEIRSALQWSQSKLADEIGVSFATVNRWENEKSTPNRLVVVVNCKSHFSIRISIFSFKIVPFLKKICIIIPYFTFF